MKSLSHYVSLLIFAMAFISLEVAAAATLSSTVNRNQISTNETLTLTVSIDQQVDSTELDLSVLQQNFEILAATPQTRSSFNRSNGQSQRTSSTTWTIILVAKNEGIMTIPAFSLGSATSQPISIKVSNSTAAKNSPKPLDVSVTTDAKEVYPNQQFVIQVELSAGNNIRDLSGSQLAIAGAEVEAFDQQTFQRVDNGIARQIVILKYSVFAKQAGELTVPAMTYTALKNGRRSAFGNSGTQVIARSNSLNIQVKQIPETGNRQWFPAQEVSITSKWSRDGSALKVGEPITRTITITAKGQQASAIPPLVYGEIDANLKAYKDQPQLDTQKSNQGFVATRIESEAIVASQAGEYVLPAVSVDWWNSKTKQWQNSTLQRQTLSVTATALPVGALSEPIADISETAKTMIINDSKPTKMWQIVSSVLALIVILQSCFLLKAAKAKPELNSNQAANISEQSAWSALQAALKADNSRAVRNNLLLWGREALGSERPISLDQLQHHAAELGVTEELKDNFNGLDIHLYKGGKQPNMPEMAKRLSRLRSALLASSRSTKKTKPELHPLYPTN